MQQSRFLNLPNEVLEYIIHLSSIKPYDDTDFLGWCYPEHSYTHLKSIALCCQRLYKLCSPFLWKHKEFILPRQHDVKKESIIQIATDILATPSALSSIPLVLGDHVCSLYRNLTTSPHFDLINSRLMAQLVCNLKALRIDFHPLPRTEHYGLRYFFEYCPHLTEVFISHCQDTYDDFDALCRYKPRLTSLTLIDCTVKERTLEIMMDLFRPTLKRLLFRQVLIEPSINTTQLTSHLLTAAASEARLGFLHPLHFQNSQAAGIPQSMYIKASPNLRQLALTDSISCSTLEQITQASPLLEKLAIVLHDYYPEQIARSLTAITSLQRMTVLSLSFRKHYPLSREFERFPCHAPSSVWSYFATCLPKLKSLYISSSRLLISYEFIPILLQYHPFIVDVMIYSISFTQPPIPPSDNSLSNLRDTYLYECRYITYKIPDEHRHYLYTGQEAIQQSYNRVIDDVSDVQLCFIKGYKQ
ncbi:hypothetical protein BCV72DRAFT_80745 [Rhizopus microsporus var. microsporus]|uniref:F-box domain-containing protein n=2 Tax=Rhizopus microsporus TaxID=58291 RepID=A0A2G4SQL5_RHIZD|nr:uncharacterized protein RHIMIDRAFT_239220 [Rhizopus microsporus ATCC 52813]ORE08793.1 hypothetical protein BCV72DRAFT_80745 [Rhizopus microsporus var. microsporus]PHZ11069.1 hypothetical protein RHIMIDRAFT_239220 [Rhizopus microsporus ATCC 52813]